MSKGNRSFWPPIIVATTGTCNARIDYNEIVGVSRMDMPSSCIDAIQDWRCARWFPDANKNAYFYNIYVFLCGFEHRLLQIHDTSVSYYKHI